MLLILVASVVLVVLIYSLPKVVVRDEGKKLEEDPTTEDAHIHDENDSEIGNLNSEQLKELKKKFDEQRGNEEELDLADSLVDFYIHTGYYDSAFWVAKVLANDGFALKSKLLRGRTFYGRMKAGGEESETHLDADSAFEVLRDVLEADPNDLRSKNMVADIYLTKGDVMSSVSLLKEILDAEPNNQEAQFQLGILSVQSGQLEKGIGRFENVIKNDSNNVEAYYWLGYCLVNTGNLDKARPVIERARELTTNPEVLAALESLIENI
jgi:outer membrane protein